MKKRILVSLVMVISLLLWGGGIGYAKVTGVCGNCHTMHNSQGGAHMMLNTTIDGTGGTGGGGYSSLTRGSCVGCHTGENTGSNITPYVYNTGSVTYGTDTLAGGNFKWVVTDDAKGHNVKGIPGMSADGNLTAGAPGDLFASSCANSCHETLFAPDDNGTALATGCQGCHLAPKHHAPQQAANVAAGAANGWFRFLSGHDTGVGKGVEGIEDVDWQFATGENNHNEYLGSAGTHTEGANAGFSKIGNTMTAYCTGCHGNFHTQLDGNANWIRHPSDAILPTDGEYAAYTVYDVIAPVARPALTAVSDVVHPGTDMVMCLSCHRAHGSPNDDMLRWNYADMVAGDNTKSGGCFVCHTTKN
jgi:predicted CXXCH cytochrome family protein